MTTNSPNPVDGDVLKELRNRYAEPKIPSCSICGGELSVQRSGGGIPTIWACSGMIDDPTGERTWIYAEGRSCADEHYERSRWTDYRSGGDSDVIDLIDAYQALLALHLNATAQPVSDGLIPVPDEFLHADQNEKGLFELSEDCMCRLSVALSQQSKGLVMPPDSVVVPKILTREMRHAWDSAPNSNTDDDDLNMQRAYSAMLAAAGGQDEQ